jgi:hypothetical protein
MRRTSDHVWICFGSDDDHALHPATVCTARRADRGTIIRFDAPMPPDLPGGPAGDAVVFYHAPAGFCQLPVRLSLIASGRAGTFRLDPAGVPAIAEDRVAQRFVVEPTGFAVVLATDDVCPVRDVSPRGLSVTSERAYAIGQVLELAFESPEARALHRGYCRVRCMKSSGEDHRYGLLALDGAEGGSLNAGLRELIDWVRTGDPRRLPKAG